MNIGKCYTIISEYGTNQCTDLENLADAICNIGINCHTDMTVLDTENKFLFNTFGPFINKCPDQDFLEKFTKILVPMQMEYMAGIFDEAKTEDSYEVDTEMNPEENILLGISDWELREAVENEDIDIEDEEEIEEDDDLDI